MKILKKTFHLSLVLLAGAAFASSAIAEDAPADGKKPKGKMGAKLLEKYDANKNGVLDPEEREAARKEREEQILKKFDKDGDGKLNDTEREAAKAEMKGRWGKGQKQGGAKNEGSTQAADTAADSTADTSAAE